MDSIRTYILSVTATAVLCTLAMQIIGKKGVTAVVLRMICGMIMACAVIRPLGDIAVTDFTKYFDRLDIEVSSAVASGTAQTAELIRQRITETTASYVQDKATELGASLSVRVTLNDDSVPVRMELGGLISPSAKSALEEIIQNDIGIGKEDQVWK